MKGAAVNKIEFRHFIDRWPRPVGDLVTMAAKIETPLGKRFLVVFHEQATIEGWDAIEIRRIDENDEIIPVMDEVILWLKDKHEDDVFASQMFGELTGMFPYQIREAIQPEIIRHSSKELREAFV